MRVSRLAGPLLASSWLHKRAGNLTPGSAVIFQHEVIAALARTHQWSCSTIQLRIVCRPRRLRGKSKSAQAEPLMMLPFQLIAEFFDWGQIEAYAAA
jgi:hypothetical protein